MPILAKAEQLSESKYVLKWGVKLVLTRSLGFRVVYSDP